MSEREENKACQQDYYSPCECITYSEEPVSIGIICRDVNSFSVVQEVFRRPTTAKEIQTFDLRIPTSEINNTIPSDLLNSTVVKSILLDCYNELTYLRIDPKSFSASTDDNEFIGIENCDLSLLNYKFLENFTALNYLLYFNVVSLSSSWVSLPVLSSLAMIRVSETEEFEGFNRFPISNVPAWSELEVFSCPHFQFLPTPLPSFKILTICMCPLFKQWNIIGQLKKLSSIHLEGFNEEEINNALDTFVLSPLVDTIVTLDLSFNKLTNVPAQIKSFSQLQYIYLTSNTISTANKESLAFITPYLKELSLLENGLSNIEPGAFQGKLLYFLMLNIHFYERQQHYIGNFRNCEIDLRSNNLTRFKSSVFKPSLEQMEKHIGFIIIYESKNLLKTLLSLKLRLFNVIFCKI